MAVEAGQGFPRLSAVEGGPSGPDSLPRPGVGPPAPPQGSLVLLSVERVLQTEHLKTQITIDCVNFQRTLSTTFPPRKTTAP